MEFINITGPAATQNTGLHRSLPYVCIALMLCPVVFYFNVFFLFALNFVIFSLRATILLNLNVNLNLLAHCANSLKAVQYDSFYRVSSSCFTI